MGSGASGERLVKCSFEELAADEHAGGRGRRRGRTLGVGYQYEV